MVLDGALDEVDALEQRVLDPDLVSHEARGHLGVNDGFHIREGKENALAEPEDFELGALERQGPEVLRDGVVREVFPGAEVLVGVERSAAAKHSAARGSGTHARPEAQREVQLGERPVGSELHGRAPFAEEVERGLLGGEGGERGIRG